jgi:hypothetical protein
MGETRPILELNVWPAPESDINSRRWPDVQEQDYNTTVSTTTSRKSQVAGLADSNNEALPRKPEFRTLARQNSRKNSLRTLSGFGIEAEEMRTDTGFPAARRCKEITSSTR